MVISEYLRDCGYKVMEAANAEEALIVLQNPDITVDVVFSDIENAGLDGRLCFVTMGACKPPGP